MSSGKDFVEFLKRVKYPGADELEASSFDWMYEIKEFAPFLQSFNSMGEENVLTDEEVAVYEALGDDLNNDRVDVDLFEKMKSMNFGENEDDVSKEDTEEEISNLEAEIAEGENYIKALELQRDHLKMLEMELHQKMDDQEFLCKLHEKEFSRLKNEALPETISKFCQTIDDAADLISKANDTLKHTLDSDYAAAKPSMQLDIEQYLKTEEEVLRHAEAYLDNLKKQASGSCHQPSDVFAEKLEREILEEFPKDCKAEALRLKKDRQITEENYVKAFYENTKSEYYVKLLEELLERKDYSTYNLPKTEMEKRMKEVKKDIEILEAEEKDLLENQVPKAIAEKLQLEFDHIALLDCKEKVERYKALLEKLKTPLDELLAQRARLELLNMILTMHDKDLKATKLQAQSIIEELDKDVKEFEKRKDQYDTLLKSKPPEDDANISEDSFFIRLNNVLGDDEPSKKLSQLTINDVLEKIIKLQEKDESLQEESKNLLEEQMNLIHCAEKSIALFDNYLHDQKWQGKDHPFVMLHELNVNLTKLGMQVKDLEVKVYEVMTDYNKKKKVLEQNSNIREARRLFVYALTDNEKFLQTIQKIKMLAESHKEASK